MADPVPAMFGLLVSGRLVSNGCPLSTIPYNFLQTASCTVPVVCLVAQQSYSLDIGHDRIFFFESLLTFTYMFYQSVRFSNIMRLTSFVFQVRTDFERLEETKFMITINSAESVNYICVFLTGLLPFPEGTVGAGKNNNYIMLLST